MDTNLTTHPKKVNALRLKAWHLTKFANNSPYSRETGSLLPYTIWKGDMKIIAVVSFLTDGVSSMYGEISGFSILNHHMH